ncbi:MAG: acyltransferase family protein [Alphaproteobacteria bacterium]|nr:acyltransferase family protein [Alphaproteobacteria bacterium]
MRNIDSDNKFATPKYRRDIDGLRAIAVLAVMVFHAVPQYFPGGFIGVDIFFVISGYLISTIIYENLAQQKFSFLTFYMRRTRRIFPTLIVVIATSLAIGWFILIGEEYTQLAKHAIGGTLFISNFMYLNEAGYWDAQSLTKIFLHLWSLAVEEQYYFIWPICLWAAWRKNLRIITFLLFLIMASFAINIYSLSISKETDFYFPLTRFWELFAGGLVAWVSIQSKYKENKFYDRFVYYIKKIFFNDPMAINHQTINEAISIFGVLIIIAGFYFISEKLPYPGWAALLPVIGTCLLIFSPGTKINRIVLGNKILVGIGLISYPLYLWHWPLFAFARILERGYAKPEILLQMTVLTFLLSWLCYRFIEKPIRHGRYGLPKLVGLVTTMSIIGVVSFVIYQNNGFGHLRLGEKLDRITQLAKFGGGFNWPKLKNDSYQGVSLAYYPKNSKESNNKAVLLIGDSNAMMYYPRFEQLIDSNPNHHRDFYMMARFACMPIPKMKYIEDGQKFCLPILEQALNFAKENDKIDQVVLAAVWAKYLYNYELPHYMPEPYFLGSENYASALKNYAEYIGAFRALGKKVTVVLTIPYGEEFWLFSQFKRKISEFPHVVTLNKQTVPRRVVDNRIARLHEDLKKAAIGAGANVIEPAQYLCTATECNVLDQDDMPIYKDAWHLNEGWVRERAKYIDQTMLP